MQKSKSEVNIPIDQWGRDHWSLLAFIEVICVDHGGELSDSYRRNMRTKGGSHWQPHYGTRLKGFGQGDLKLLLAEHDDWDVAADIETAGLLTNQGTGINPIWKLTPQGHELAAKLRVHKANGGSFSTFTFTHEIPN